jgi:hypothetical protein
MTLELDHIILSWEGRGGLNRAIKQPFGDRTVNGRELDPPRPAGTPPGRGSLACHRLQTADNTLSCLAANHSTVRFTPPKVYR